MVQINTWGYKAIAVSVATGQGLSELSAALAGKLSAVIGPSGVGKSSIINALRLQQQQLQEQQHGILLSDAATAPTAQHAAGVTDAPPQASSYGAAVRRQPHANKTEEAFRCHDVRSIAESSSSDAQNPSTLTHRGNGSASTSAESSAASDAPHVQTENHEQSQDPHQQQQQQHELENRNVPDQPAASLQISTKPQHGDAGSVHGTQGRDPGSRPLVGPDQAASSTAEAAPELGLAGSAAGQSAGAVQLQSVGEMSNIGRGMHTTRHVALLEVMHWLSGCLVAGGLSL